MLNVVMLSVAFFIDALSVIMLNVIMLNAITLNVVTLNVVMLSVVMMGVVAQKKLVRIGGFSKNKKWLFHSQDGSSTYSGYKLRYFVYKTYFFSR
jgi:hypothetical protein